MRRVNAFLIILIVAITALIASTAIGFALFSSAQNPYSWMQQMWSGNNNNGYGGMMGSGNGMMGGTGSTTPTATSASLPYFGVLFAVLIGVTVVGIVGVTYYLVYPQIRMGATPIAVTTTAPTNMPIANGANAYESVAKTLTEEERKVINVLNQHNGK